jgi:tetratricopeptide (TPR) repeat protein
MRFRTIVIAGLGASTLWAGGRLNPAHAGSRQEAPNEESGTPRAGVPLETKRPEIPPPPDEPPPADGGLEPYLASTDQAIQLFERRVANHPNDHTGYRHLGELYERKARETGDLALFARAEAALRTSLELFPDQPRAEAALAAVLCSRHKFAEALEIALKRNRQDPRDIDALATLSDA